MPFSSSSFVTLGDDEARLSGPAFLLRSSESGTSLGRSLTLRMQHFGQNKELGVPPVNLFRSCHESRNVACSKFLGVNDKNVHGSIGK